MSGKRTKIYKIAACIVGVIAVIAAAAGPMMSQIEQPHYAVINAKGSIELRQYDAMIAAETEVRGERKAAISEGFRRIAAYIFGANEPNAKIAMTTPVQQQTKQTIAMTAPVTQQFGADVWTVRFIMPKIWTAETLPKPSDERVKLVPMPQTKMVAIRFSGTTTDNHVAIKTAELKKYITEHNLTANGEPILALYNPPWTLPFFRRNEIMFAVAGAM